MQNFWIARYKDGDLFLYDNKPVRADDGYDVFDAIDGDSYQIASELFPEVTWENSPQRVRLELCGKPEETT